MQIPFEKALNGIFEIALIVDLQERARMFNKHSCRALTAIVDVRSTSHKYSLCLEDLLDVMIQSISHASRSPLQISARIYRNSYYLVRGEERALKIFQIMLMRLNEPDFHESYDLLVKNSFKIFHELGAYSMKSTACFVLANQGIDGVAFFFCLNLHLLFSCCMLHGNTVLLDSAIHTNMLMPVRDLLELSLANMFQIGPIFKVRVISLFYWRCVFPFLPVV